MDSVPVGDGIYGTAGYKPSKKQGEPIYEELDAATQFVRVPPAPVQKGFANPTYGMSGVTGGAAPIYETIGQRPEGKAQNDPSSVVPIYEDIKPFSKHDTYMSVDQVHPGGDQGYMSVEQVLQNQDGYISVGAADPYGELKALPRDQGGDDASIANPLYAGANIQITGV